MINHILMEDCQIVFWSNRQPIIFHEHEIIANTMLQIFMSCYESLCELDEHAKCEAHRSASSIACLYQILFTRSSLTFVLPFDVVFLCSMDSSCFSFVFVTIHWLTFHCCNCLYCCTYNACKWMSRWFISTVYFPSTGCILMAVLPSTPLGVW